MAADESGTLAQLKTHRKELIEPKTAEYHGRVVKLMGDGMLAEFPSVVNAVQCAVDVQRGTKQLGSIRRRARFKWRIRQIWRLTGWCWRLEAACGDRPFAASRSMPFRSTC